LPDSCPKERAAVTDNHSAVEAMGTNAAVAEALRAARGRAEAERLARRELSRAKRRHRILTAAGVDVEDLSEDGRRILEWLADWDEPTTDGIVELVVATRASAVDEHRAVFDRGSVTFPCDRDERGVRE
jgi:hypothetical protein